MPSSRDSVRVQETEQKVRLALRTLQQLAADKQRRSAWGQVAVKLFWEDGYLKSVEISDVTSIKDVTPEG
jgi:hypothetical protein